MIYAVGVYSSYRLASAGSQEAQRIMLEGEKAKIKTATDSLAVALSKGLEGITQQDQQVGFLRKAIQDIFFESDRSGYYYIYSGTVNIAHPVSTNLQGKDLDNVRGSDGVYSVRELAKAAAGGGGFVQFQWKKPGQGDKPKSATPRVFPEQNIGSGQVCTSTISTPKLLQCRSHTKHKQNPEHCRGFHLSGAVSVGLSAAEPFPLRSIVKPIQDTTEAAKKIAAGNLDVQLQAQGTDEPQPVAAVAQHDGVVAQKESGRAFAKQEEALRTATEARQAMVEAQGAKDLSDKKSQDLLAASDRLETVVEILTSLRRNCRPRSNNRVAGQRNRPTGSAPTVASMEEMNATVLEVAGRPPTRPIRRTGPGPRPRRALPWSPRP